MTRGQDRLHRIESAITRVLPFVHFSRGGCGQRDPEDISFRIDVPDLADITGWIEDALPFRLDQGRLVRSTSRVQSIAVGIHLEDELWGWPLHACRCKGMLVVALGPLFVEFGG